MFQIAYFQCVNLGTVSSFIGIDASSSALKGKRNSPEVEVQLLFIACPHGVTSVYLITDEF